MDLGGGWGLAAEQQCQLHVLDWLYDRVGGRTDQAVDIDPAVAAAPAGLPQALFESTDLAEPLPVAGLGKPGDGAGFDLVQAWEPEPGPSAGTGTRCRLVDARRSVGPEPVAQLDAEELKVSLELAPPGGGDHPVPGWVAQGRGAG